ncbi:MAG TPA: Clp protease N-terminal domain-containing protein, partial [Aggregatilineales bacterium]|nr:Clp protease N-terminal domain-containing protein [Aggregatilineales bacterium]
MTKFEAIRQQAQWESSRLHHYYLGVEHLFLALLETENSLTSQLLRQYNVLPELLRYELDELIGQSEDRRFWEGFRHTPRFEKILKTARALGDNDDPGEREILLAILIEGDSIPVRALEALNVNLDTLRDTAANPEYLAPPIDIASPELESELPLMATEIDLVRELFIGYNDIRIAHEFNTGRDPARMFMVQTEIAPAVVRFDHAANLIQEKRRYDTLLGPKLGVNSSHPLADITGFVTSTHLGAVKYTFSTPTETLMDLRQFALEHEQGLKHLAGIIREGIFQPLNDILWRRGERYRFNLWREYESTLPPALVVKNQPVIHVDTAFKPLQAWSFDASVEVNAHVRLEGFTVDRVMPHRKSVLLCAGRGREAVNQSAQVEITGLDDEQLAKLAAGQKVRSFEGKVIRTRKLMLLEQVMALSPGFSILGKELYSPLGTLPNPVVMLPE